MMTIMMMMMTMTIANVFIILTDTLVHCVIVNESKRKSAVIL